MVVREFHEAFGLEAPDSPTPPEAPLVRLRLRLIAEEYKEVRTELEALLAASSVPEQYEAMRRLLKELCDLRYVVEGCAVSLGLPFDDAYAEVHHSNMSKLGEDGRPIYDEGGKVMKGPNYAPADMKPYVPDPIEGTAEDVC
jgi:predicted HAD superfamily Cof-like phosphohydrolase